MRIADVQKMNNSNFFYFYALVFAAWLRLLVYRLLTIPRTSITRAGLEARARAPKGGCASKKRRGSIDMDKDMSEQFSANHAGDYRRVVAGRAPLPPRRRVWVRRRERRSLDSRARVLVLVLGIRRSRRVRSPIASSGGCQDGSGGCGNSSRGCSGPWPSAANPSSSSSPSTRA